MASAGVPGPATHDKVPLAAVLARLAALAEADKAEGNAAFKRGDSEAAVACYGRALQAAEPGGATALVVRSNRAAALTRLGRYADALADADEVARERPAWAKAHFRRGAALFGLRRHAEAAAAHAAGLALEPDNEALAAGLALAQSAARAEGGAEADEDGDGALDADALRTPPPSALDACLARLAAAGPGLRPLPVLLLSGFLGAGKTTLLSSLLRRTSARLAVLVNDSAEVNVDEMTLRREAAPAARAAGAVVALSNGCVCCTLRDDLLAQLAELCLASPPFDAAVVECTGVSDPLPVAAALTAAGAGGRSLADHCPLDSLVTVVDAAAWARLAANPAAAPLLLRQVETADCVVLTKCDAAGDEAARAAEQSLRALNPSAPVLRALHGDVDEALLLRTGRFTTEAGGSGGGGGGGGGAAAAAARHPAEWAEEQRAAAAGVPARGHAPETEALGCAAVSVRAPRPCHPGRLAAALLPPPPPGAGAGAAAAAAAAWPCAPLLRSKGLLWMAGAPPGAGPWGWQTWPGGARPRHGPARGGGWADGGGGGGGEGGAGAEAEAGPPVRRETAAVFIGPPAAAEAAAAGLRAALLTDEEMGAGDEAAWAERWGALHEALWGRGDGGGCAAEEEGGGEAGAAAACGARAAAAAAGHGHGHGHG